MYEFIRKSLWAVYLGGALTWAGINVGMKEFWIIIIPIAFLVLWSQHKDKGT